MVTRISNRTSTRTTLSKIKKVKSKNNPDLTKYSGKLKAKIDPIQFQRSIRNEWD